jgi:hypothetical protein
MWMLIDSLMPNEPLLVNLDNVTDFKWKSGSLIIGYVDGTQDEYECEQKVFVSIAQRLNVAYEIE